jgi:hypothetical protein
VDDSGDWSAPSRAHVCRRSRYRPGRRQSTEQWRNDVCRTLSEKLGTGSMTPTYHSVRDNRGQKRFDGRKERDHES